MATLIKCEVDGLSEPLEVQGGLSFGYSSSASVGNAANNKKITFGPVGVSSFSFTVSDPDAAATKALIKWLVSHEVKGKVTFKISDQEMDAKTRDLVLEQVCLEQYNESISEYGSQISLTLVGQKVTVDDIPVDQTQQR
jgi:hypothetical protein